MPSTEKPQDIPFIRSVQLLFNLHRHDHIVAALHALAGCLWLSLIQSADHQAVILARIVQPDLHHIDRALRSQDPVLGKSGKTISEHAAAVTHGQRRVQTMDMGLAGMRRAGSLLTSTLS